MDSETCKTKKIILIKINSELYTTEGYAVKAVNKEKTFNNYKKEFMTLLKTITYNQFESYGIDIMFKEVSTEKNIFLPDTQEYINCSADTYFDDLGKTLDDIITQVLIMSFSRSTIDKIVSMSSLFVRLRKKIKIDANGFVILYGTFNDGRFESEMCPFCGHYHFHGFDEGHRLRHCKDYSPGFLNHKSTVELIEEKNIKDGYVIKYRKKKDKSLAKKYEKMYKKSQVT